MSFVSINGFICPDVEQPYGRLIQAETPNIVGNWRFDEGFGPYVFDSSKRGGVYIRSMAH
jgi:hypothetical protein